MSRPLYAVSSAAELSLVVRGLAAEGWTVRDGLATPDQPWDLTTARLVVTGVITDDVAAAEAVLAAARGAGVAAVADPDSDAGRAFLADLARIGPVRRHPAASATRSADDLPLTVEQRALLDRPLHSVSSHYSA